MTMNAETSDTAAATAAQGPAGAPEKGSSKKHGSRKKGAPKARKTAVGGMSKKAGKKRSVKPAGKAGPRRKSKGATILELIQRAKGATLAEIMTCNAPGCSPSSNASFFRLSSGSTVRIARVRRCAA